MDGKSLPGDTRAGLLNMPLVHVLIIIALGFLAYSNTFHGPIQWDGVPYIIENPLMKDVGNFISSSWGYDFNPRRYIGNLTFALNYQFGGAGATGYHIVNLLIHVSSAVLVYVLIVLTFQTPGMTRSGGSFRSPRLIALFSSLLFVAHPVQTQAVAYIYQRYTSLATLFYLLCLVLYVKGRLSMREPEAVPAAANGGKLVKTFRFAPAAFYLLSLVSAVLAMKTKEIAFTLPLVVVLYEFTFFKMSFRRKLLFLLPILLTLVIVPLSVLHSDKTLGELLADVDTQARLQTDMARWDYFMTEMRVIVTYLRLLFLPINQNVDYDYPVYHSLLEWPVFLSFVFLLSLFGCGIYLLYATRGGNAKPSAQAPFLRLIGFGLLWFFITLSVESSFIPIADVIFEHRVYLPSIGFFVVVTTGLMTAAERFNAHKTVIAVLCLALPALSIATYSRNNIWTDMTELWSDTVRKSPDKTRPRYNLARVYFEEGRMSESLHEYQVAADLHPEDSEAQYNLATAYAKQNRWEEAVRKFHAALAIKPDYAYARNNLGTAYLKVGRTNDAVREYKAALALMPDYKDAHYNLGLLYSQHGRHEEAVRELQAVLSFTPDDANALSSLGKTYLNMGRLNEAAGKFREALVFDSGSADTRFNLGIVYFLQGRMNEAIGEFELAVNLSPKDANIRNNLCAAYLQQGRSDEALRELRTAVALDPGNLEIRGNLERLTRSIKAKKAAR